MYSVSALSLRYLRATSRGRSRYRSVTSITLGPRHRLPLLPYVGGKLQLCGHSAYQDLHELPFANLAGRAACLSRFATAIATGKSLVWKRVNDLPDFVYFDHSIHINKGVGCNTCHGPVDRMPLMYNDGSLQMEWCLDCHRAPGQKPASARPGVQYAL